MPNYQEMNVTTIQPWERINLLHAREAAISEYQELMLPILIKTVDTNVNKDCGGITKALGEAIKAASPRHFIWYILQTGRDSSSTRQFPRFKHYALGIAAAIRPLRLAIVWDPIKATWGKGQDNVQTGGYFRWDPNDWKQVKSVHYSGVHDETIRYNAGVLNETGPFTYW